MSPSTVRPLTVSTGTPPSPFPIALTVDVHEEDQPVDVSRAAHWLHTTGIRATFFVPSVLFERSDFRPHVALLTAQGHQVGSHGHHHDFNEIRLLMRGAAADLDFLRRSRGLYEELFGCAPIAFRSPAWCPLGPAAIHTLVSLGYRVDASATPQRLPIFSSTPYANTWLFSPRSIHELTPGLLEIPTSCLLLPAASPTFLTLRRQAALAFLRLLIWEARLPAKILCVQFHVSDFAADTAPPLPDEPLSLGSFLPRADGGLRFKVFLRERDPRRIYRITQEIIDMLRCQSGAKFMTLCDLAESKASYTD